MIVLSLFDGMSCGRVALERAGRNVTRYYASEIDKYAIKISQKNYPDIVQLGNVVAVRQMAQAGVFGKVDLLIGGSPCQGFSFSGNQLAFNDPRSALFFEYVWTLRALKEQNPDIKFMLENVRMKKEHLAVITEYLGVEPVFINSALVSAQSRPRYYWCNWRVEQPADRGIVLRDILETGEKDYKEHVVSVQAINRANRKNYSKPQILPEKTGTINSKNNSGQLSLDKGTTFIPLSPAELDYMSRNYHHDSNKPKSSCLTACLRKGVPYNVLVDRRAIAGITETEKGFRPYKNDGRKGSLSEIGVISKPESKSKCATSAHSPKVYVSGSIEQGIVYRKLTPVECERLQGLPDNYTAGVSNSQRYKMLGNGWQVDTVQHIFESMPT